MYLMFNAGILEKRMFFLSLKKKKKDLPKLKCIPIKIFLESYVLFKCLYLILLISSIMTIICNIIIIIFLIYHRIRIESLL